MRMDEQNVPRWTWPFSRLLALFRYMYLVFHCSTASILIHVSPSFLLKSHLNHQKRERTINRVGNHVMIPRKSFIGRARLAFINGTQCFMLNATLLVTFNALACRVWPQLKTLQAWAVIRRDMQSMPHDGTFMYYSNNFILAIKLCTQPARLFCLQSAMQSKISTGNPGQWLLCCQRLVFHCFRSFTTQPSCKKFWRNETWAWWKFFSLTF